MKKLGILIVLLSTLVLAISGTTQAEKELIVGTGAASYKTEGDGANLAAYPLNANVYEPLVRLTPDYKVAPALATKWEYVADNTWRFYLRRGVKFHNGEEFTASAVKFTLDRVARTGGSFIHVGEDSVKIIDDYTVDITPAKRNLRLVEGLTHPSFGMMAPGSDPGKAPVGTGPFKFVSYKEGVEIVVERNEDYWGEKAELDKINFKFIPDNNTRIMALQSGDIDVALYLPRESASLLKATKGIEVLTSLPGRYSALYLAATGKAPHDILTDVKVRLAIAAAIDRETIVQGVWEGNAELNQTFIPPAILGEYRSIVEGFAYDKDKAIELLEEAGWKEGKDGIREKEGRRLSIILISGFPSAEYHRPVPEVIQAQLKEVGIDMKIIEYNDTGLFQDSIKKGEGDIWIEDGSQNTADPTFLPELLFHTNGYYVKYLNAPTWPGEEFDRLIDEARDTPDIEEATRLSAEAMRILIDEKAIAIPIASLYNIHAIKDKVKGYQPHPSRINDLWAGVYIED